MLSGEYQFGYFIKFLFSTLDRFFFHLAASGLLFSFMPQMAEENDIENQASNIETTIIYADTKLDKFYPPSLATMHEDNQVLHFTFDHI